MKRTMIAVILIMAMVGCYRPYTPPPPTYYSQPAACGCAPVQPQCMPVQTQCVPVTSQCVPATSQCVPVGGRLQPTTYAPPPVAAYGTPPGVYNPAVAPALPR